MVRSLCCSKEGLKRGTWSAEEDMILSQYIRIHGAGGWKTLAQKAGLKRCGKSCRLRWLNYVRPDIKRGNMSSDEEELIIMMHWLLGNRWSLIAGRLPGRTDNEIKNYWKTQLSKTLSVNQSQGKTRQNLEPRSKSRCILQSHVIKTTPTRVTTEVKLHAMDHAIKLPGTTQIMSVSAMDHAIKLPGTTQIMSVPKSGCNLPANDSITNYVAVTNSDVNVGETEVRNFTCSMSTLPDQPSPDCKHFAGDAYVTGENLCDLKELSSSQLNLLCSPSSLWTDFGWEEFRTEPATSLEAGTKKYEGICSDYSFQFANDPGSEEIYDHIKQVDWIRELDYI